MGYSACSPATVLTHSKDLGTVNASLRRLDHSNTAIACASCGSTHRDVIDGAAFLDTTDPICCEVAVDDVVKAAQRPGAPLGAQLWARGMKEGQS
jgi:hypothetical protein